MHKTTVELRGLSLEVEFDYTPAERGSKGSYGEPLEPDWPEEIEITEIYHAGEEILCIMDDASISKVEKMVLSKRGEW